MNDVRALLAILAAHPERVGDVRPNDVPALVGELEALRALLWLRLNAPPAPNGNGGKPAPEDRRDDLLDVKAAAEMLGVKERWMYRKAGSLPFTRRLGPRTLRFSRRGIERWLKTRNN